MKQGWELKKLGYLAKVLAGQSPPGSSYNNVGIGTPFYQGKTEFRERFIGGAVKWTTQETKIAQKGDILMSVRAPVGPINEATERICIGRGLAAIRVRSDIYKDYLWYVLLMLQPEISGHEGAVFSSINKADIEAIDIPLPLLDEQKRIVAVLDEAFAGLETARANAEANLKNAEELYQSFLDMEVEKQLEAFGSIELRELAEEITDGDHSAPPKVKQGIPFITITNIDKSQRQIVFENTFFVPEDYYNSLHEKRQPKHGDVLYTVTGSFGVAVHVNSDQRFCFQRHIGLIRPKHTMNSAWLSSVLMSGFVRKQAEKTATGAAQLTVSLRALRSFKLPNTPPDVKSQFEKEHERLTEYCREATVLGETKLQNLSELRQSLLQKAFAGELT